MSEKWEQEVGEVLRNKEVSSTREMTMVVLYHHSEETFWQRLDLFCQVFTRQFFRVYPSVCIHWQKICLPLAEKDDVLPQVEGAHILLTMVSIECLLELHQQTPLYAALAKTSENSPYHAGIIAHSVPLENEQIRFTARFPTEAPSLELSVDTDEVYTEIANKIWSWARNLQERL